MVKFALWYPQELKPICLDADVQDGCRILSENSAEMGRATHAVRTSCARPRIAYCGPRGGSWLLAGIPEERGESSPGFGMLRGTKKWRLALRCAQGK